MTRSPDHWRPPRARRFCVPWRESTRDHPMVGLIMNDYLIFRRKNAGAARTEEDPQSSQNGLLHEGRAAEERARVAKAVGQDEDLRPHPRVPPGQADLAAA